MYSTIFQVLFFVSDYMFRPYMTIIRFKFFSMFIVLAGMCAETFSSTQKTNTIRLVMEQCFWKRWWWTSRYTKHSEILHHVIINITKFLDYVRLLCFYKERYVSEAKSASILMLKSWEGHYQLDQVIEANSFYRNQLIRCPSPTLLNFRSEASLYLKKNTDDRHIPSILWFP